MMGENSCYQAWALVDDDVQRNPFVPLRREYQCEYWYQYGDRQGCDVYSHIQLIALTA